jgi:outer membrane receptor for ferrienterochelin and colicins
MRSYWVCIVFLIVSAPVAAQKDSLLQLEEVVVSATRQERRLGNVAIPVQLIQRKQIQQAGSMRLRDILQEQAGLQLVNGFGAGLQMQGLSPEHTLILIDGQPLVGRTSGVLDISRISVSGIKRIEIVKGPSSSLYGSEAMAGIINLITDNSVRNKAELSLRYGVADPNRQFGIPFGASSLQHTEVDGHASFQLGKWTIKQSNNYLYADAVSYRPMSQDRIARPINRFTNQTIVQTSIGTKMDLRWLARINQDRFQQQFSVSNNGSITTSFGKELNTEWNIQPTLTYRATPHLTLSSKAYWTNYTGDQQLRFTDRSDSLYQDQFAQRLARIENQAEIKRGRHAVVLGFGLQAEQAHSTRYDAYDSKKENSVRYGFAQWEIRLSEKWISTIGARFDHHTLYAAALTPKWAIRYQPSPRLAVKASVGQGFKAPDFRQLFLNFTNTAAGGYSVIGSVDAIRVINNLEQQGLIADRKPDYSKLSLLRPEFSTGYNAEIHYRFSTKVETKFSLFRNDINSLIDVRHVATRIDGTQLFSYLNVNRAFTQGLEFGFQWQVHSRWMISSGYQYLETGDKEERRRILDQQEYIRDASGASRLMKISEYVGLPNRSKHQAQLKISYEKTPEQFINLRLLYRSRWTVANSNGNSSYDQSDEFASGFLLVNMSAGFSLTSFLSVQTGIENLLNYHDLFYQPTLQPRTVFVQLRCKLWSQKIKTVASL